MVVALQTVVSRSVDLTKVAVVTVGTIHAGEAVNVIPDSARFEISIRSFEPEVRAVLKQRITAIIEAVAQGFDAVAAIDYDEGHPVVCNSDAENKLATAVARDLDRKRQDLSADPRKRGFRPLSATQARRPAAAGQWRRFGDPAQPAL